MKGKVRLADISPFLIEMAAANRLLKQRLLAIDREITKIMRRRGGF